MAYLLDLHLFLSRPIKPAPTEEEVMSEMELAMANGETVYGRFPQTATDLVADRVREILDSSTELDCLVRPCERAFRLYTKTKEKPSRESMKRAKNMPHEGLHPMFIKALGGNELSALAFSDGLKAYRAKQTVLESEGHAAKAKHLKASQGGYAVDYATPATQAGYPGSFLNHNSQAGFSRFGAGNDFMSQDYMGHGSQGLFTQVGFKDPSQDESSQSHFSGAAATSLHTQGVMNPLYSQPFTHYNSQPLNVPPQQQQQQQQQAAGQTSHYNG